MKVSEAINKLEVGETVWVKGKVSKKEKAGYPLQLEFAGFTKWIMPLEEISLTKPTSIDALAQEYDVEPETIRDWLDRGHKGSFEKLVVPDYVAEWFKANKISLESNIAAAFRRIGSDEHYTKGSIYEWLSDSSNEPIQTLFKMKNGYTVNPKRWVVKDSDDQYVYDLHLSHMFSTAHSSYDTKLDVLTFTDKSKAEAVATLVEGSVEEVAE